MADGHLHLTFRFETPVEPPWPPERVSAAAGRVLSFLEHLRYDVESDDLLASLVDGLCAGDLDRLLLIAHGDEEAGIRPFQVLTDPRAAPSWALPFAAQFVGGVMPLRLPGEDDAAYLDRARAEVLRPRGMIRGSVEAYQLGLSSVLTGSRYVRVLTRYEGSAWRFLVVVLRAEAPDPAAVYARANADDLILAGARATVAIVDAPVIDEIDWLLIDDAVLLIDDAAVRENWERL